MRPPQDAPAAAAIGILLLFLPPLLPLAYVAAGRAEGPAATFARVLGWLGLFLDVLIVGGFVALYALGRPA